MRIDGEKDRESATDLFWNPDLWHRRPCRFPGDGWIDCPILGMETTGHPCGQKIKSDIRSLPHTMNTNHCQID